MKRILITGGSGLVGRHLKEILPGATYISSRDFDLARENEVHRLFEERWDRVIHLAARVGGIVDNIAHPLDFIEENLMINTLVVKYARLNSVPRLTAILSTCIYPDEVERYPMVESDLHNGPPQAANFSYAIAKRAMAVQLDACNEQYGTAYNYLIPCNLYGEHDHFDPARSHFLSALIGKIVEAERDGRSHIDLLGTGRSLRQFMYAGDLARVISECIEHDTTASFNVAVDENLSLRKLAEITLKACGKDFELRFDHASPDGQYRKDVSNALMRKVFSNFQFTSLETGVRKVYDAYKARI